MELVRRFDVFLVRLDPTEGHEIRKTRPALVISPDEMNEYLGTVIVAPLTTRGAPYPSRVRVRFAGRQGQIALDQVRTIDKSRLLKRLGAISDETRAEVLDALAEMFGA